MRKPALLLCLLAICTFVKAQQSRQYVFTHLTNASGLASNAVSAVVQDKSGYIWVGSINGLQRYDGNKFLTFRNNRSNPQSIPNDNVTRLFIDKAGRLWVICGGNKVGIFNTKNFTFTEVPIRMQVEYHRFHTHFLEDKQGRLSIVIGKLAMVTYNEQKKEFAEEYNLMQWPKGWRPIKIFLDTLRNQYWMSSDSGLLVYDTKSRNFNYRGHNPDKNLVIEKFSAYTYAFLVHCENNERFWFCRWVPLTPRPEVFSLDMRTGKVSSYDPEIYEDIKDYHEINGITVQQNGKLWFWGQPFVAEYNEAANSLHVLKNKMENDYSLHFDVTNFLYEDREHNLWVCTNNGLFIFNPTGQLFNNISNIRPGSLVNSERFVSSVLENNENEIWVGTWGDGIFSYDNDFRPLVNPVSSNPKYNKLFVLGMMKRSNGDIWIGCQFGQLLIYNPRTRSVQELFPRSLEKKTIRQIAEDKNGNIWLGSQNGHLVKWNAKSSGQPAENDFILISDFKSRILKLYVGMDGNLWVGTDLYGAYKVDPAKEKILAHYSHRNSEVNNLMTDAAADFVQYNDSIMIIASGGLNLLNKKTNRITYFGTDEGLPSNNVNNIIRDRNGFLWLGLYNGICRLNFNKRVITSYSARNGIINDNIQVGSALLLTNGHIAMGTSHDFLVFQPVEIAGSETSPDVMITAIRVLNRNLSVDSLAHLGKVTLKHDANPVSIEFSALNYRQQNQLNYYHQLEGIDKEWIRSENNIATYTWLPSGTYTFKVKCENGYGVASVHITSFKILVQPPFWKTWWFYGTVILVLIAILYLIDKERIKRLFQLQQVRTQIAGNLHKDINTTLNNINLLSEIAKIKVDKDITKSKEYIDQINSKSRKMIDDMDDMLWSIDPMNDNMEKTLERMTEFADGLKNTHSCSIEVIVHSKIKSLKLSMKTRHEMFLIFKEALSNIAENSSCTSSIINIDLVKTNLVIKIWDKRNNYDNRLFQHHIQMEEMQKRAAEIDATLDIETDSKGITLLLKVPVK